MTTKKKSTKKRTPKYEYSLSVSYAGYSRAEDNDIDRELGITHTGSGFALGERDLYYTFETKLALQISFSRALDMKKLIEVRACQSAL
jgi:hypothetical protein